MIFVSSSFVKAQKISIFSIFSYVKTKSFIVSENTNYNTYCTYFPDINDLHNVFNKQPNLNIIDISKFARTYTFNDEELYKIANDMESPFNSVNQHIEFIVKKTNVNIICVTKGKYGAVLYHKGDWFYNSGYKVKVVDTVGAGDAFLATLVNGLVKNDLISFSLNE